jgi:hypothetical protein
LPHIISFIDQFCYLSCKINNVELEFQGQQQHRAFTRWLRLIVCALGRFLSSVSRTQGGKWVRIKIEKPTRWGGPIGFEEERVYFRRVD